VKAKRLSINFLKVDFVRAVPRQQNRLGGTIKEKA